ncbi:site-specific integrase [Dysgonomonas sp. 216]|nr:site-specific integrase [Dysgonomonas sp. 216]
MNIQNKIHMSVLLDTRDARKDGTFPVKLMIYYDKGKFKRYSLKNRIYLSKENWIKLNSPRLKLDSLIKIKTEIDKELGIASGIIKKLGNEFTLDLFNALYYDKPTTQKPEKDLIYNIYQKYIDELRKEKRIGSALAYETAMKSMKKFSPNLPLNKITPAFLKEYEDWMISKNKSITTVGIYLRSFRAIINIAKTDGFITEKQYPFGPKKKKKYEIPEGRNIKKALPTDNIKLIIGAVMQSPEAEFSRDIWLFSMYCYGMNMADVFSLKYENINDGFIFFTRKKTDNTTKKKAPIVVYITEPIQSVLDKWGNKDKNPRNYIFNVFTHGMTHLEQHHAKKTKTRQINGYMKRLSIRLGIDSKLTTYVARHSYATISKNNGVNIAEISENLGHSSLETTKNYLDSFPLEHKKEKANEFLRNFDE